MKVLKGFLSVILATIMLVSLAIFSGLLMFRIFLSGPSLGNLARTMIEQNQEFDMDSLFEGMRFDSEEIDKIMDDMSEYISKDELYDEIGDLSSQMIRYAAGNISSIDATNFKKVMKEAAKKYEKKTGESVDIDELEESIDKAVKELEKEAEKSETPQEVTTIFNTLYSNGTLIGCVVVFVVCGLLIVVMFKSVKPLLIHLAILGFIHGITNGVLGLLLSSIPMSGNEASMELVLAPIKGLFLKTALICVIVAIVSIVLIIILSVVRKKQPEVAPQPAYPEQGDVIDQIRATSMAPDNNSIPPQMYQNSNQPNNNNPNNNNFNQ